MPALTRTASLRSAAVTACLTVLGVAMIATGAPAGAQTPSTPSDSSMQGYLGFCDATNHQVRSGAVDAAPFAWKTVSSVPVPSGYTKTTVVAFQPRKDVDPLDWSGKQLTGASTFTSAAHPMTEGTQLDPALLDFTGAYPVQAGGLVQLRMFFGAVNRPAIITPYPAAFVKITGNRWTQVGGGRVDCAAGKATSTERQVLPEASFSPKQPRPVPLSAAAVAAATRQASGGGRGSAGGGRGGASASSPGAAGDAAMSNAADTSDRRHAAEPAETGSAAWWAIPLVALVAVVVAGALVARRRRTSTT